MSALEWITTKFPPAYFYVGKWDSLFSIRVISLVLFSTLIWVLPQFQKDNRNPPVQIQTDNLHWLMSWFVLVMESRIGLVELIIIICNQSVVLHQTENQYLKACFGVGGVGGCDYSDGGRKQIQPV